MQVLYAKVPPEPQVVRQRVQGCGAQLRPVLEQLKLQQPSWAAGGYWMETTWRPVRNGSSCCGAFEARRCPANLASKAASEVDGASTGLRAGGHLPRPLGWRHYSPCAPPHTP